MNSDIIGRRFGSLVVFDFDSSKDSNKYYLCECDCGKIISVRRDHLLRDETKSCGCRKSIASVAKMSEMVGKRFGKLRVIKYDHTDKYYQRHWLCECECGNLTLAYECSLLSGSKKSCGCLIDETRHGMCGTRLHNIWTLMLQRCQNQNSSGYERYGGSGIKVCDEWHNFKVFRDWAFANGYSDDLSIDRINYCGDYCPENCRWVDALTQGNNRRDNHRISYCGQNHTIAEWARILNVRYSTLWHRIDNGNMIDFIEYFGEVDENWSEG